MVNDSRTKDIFAKAKLLGETLEKVAQQYFTDETENIPVPAEFMEKLALKFDTLTNIFSGVPQIYESLAEVQKTITAAIDARLKDLQPAFEVLAKIIKSIGDIGEEFAKNPPLPATSTPFNKKGVAPLATCPPIYAAARAIFWAKYGWPLDEQGLPRFVQPIRNGVLEGVVSFHILVPWDATPDEITIAHKELATQILKEIGPDTAWLHMLCSAYAMSTERVGEGKYIVIPREEVYRCLGLNKRTDLTRWQKDEKAFAEIGRLSAIGLKIQRLRPAGTKKWRGQTVNVADYSQVLTRLWKIDVHKFGQVYLHFDEEDKPITYYEDWQLVVKEGLWGELFLQEPGAKQFGYLAREMLEKIDRHNCPLGAALAVLLTFKTRFNPGEPLEISVREIIEFGGEDTNPMSRDARYTLKNQVINAIEEQRKWGWNPDYSQWPAELRPGGDADAADDIERHPEKAAPRSMPRGYWDDFLKCKVVFRPAYGVSAESQAAALIFEATKQVRLLGSKALPQPKPKKVQSEKTWTGSEVKALRKKLGWTQAKLASYLGVTQAFVSMLEKDKRVLTAAQRKKLGKLAQKAEGGEE